MDHEKTEMKSDTEEKENSSANESNADRLNSEEGYIGTNPDDNDPSRILQPFFVADTLEDDESMMIPPSQDDSGLMVPSTPALADKSDKAFQGVDPNESTLSILEETCINTEKRAPHNTSGDDANQNACNESDMTQDLDLEPTQPIIPSNPPFEHPFHQASFKEDFKKAPDDEEDDDDWQLKFSETQTQDALINFQKEDENKEETKSAAEITKEKVDEEEELNDDDLPETLSIEVPQNKEAETDSCSSVKVPEMLDILSDDEIEPSQSCLSEYKGETISASYKVQPSADDSVEEIPQLSSEKDVAVKDDDSSNKVKTDTCDENEKRTITLSESEPKLVQESGDALHDKSLSIEEIPVVVDIQNDKESDAAEHHVCNDVEKKISDDEDLVEELVEDEKKKKSAEPLLKVSEEVVKLIETNGGGIEEIKLSEYDVEETEENKAAKSPEAKSKTVRSRDGMSNSDEHSNEVDVDEEQKSFKQQHPDKINMQKKDEVENSVEVIEEEKRNVVNSQEKAKPAESVDVSKVVDISDTSKKDLIEETGVDTIKSKETADSKTPEKDVSKVEINVDVSKESDFDEGKLAKAVSDSESNKLPDESSQPNTRKIVEERSETSPKTFALPSAPSPSFTSLLKQKVLNKSHHDASLVVKLEKKVSVGSYKDAKSVEKFFKVMGVKLTRDQIQSFLSKVNEETEFRPVFSFANNEIFLTEYYLGCEHLRRDSGISPVCSSSTTTGEMADISSLSSGKSASGGIQMEATQMSSQETASEMFPKTSTQKSPKMSGIIEGFGMKDSAEKTEAESNISPIVSNQKAKGSASKRKRGGKKNVESSSTEELIAPEPKRRRPKPKTKAKPKATPKDVDDSTEESKDAVTEEKPKTGTRRKKGATILPDIKPEEIKAIVENFEMSTEDDSSLQEEANFGSIIPGVKVMARWKDGYYYSGMVQSQEIDGKWSVLFEDGFLRTITTENLIKIAILPKGTSVLVQSPDDYYDPGIVCGHFREGNKVGYEVELDNGVTKRYTRSAVILSSDQAKLILSTGPPTTPKTMTINLDNIVDGKRKRKSVQSTEPTPPAAVKKSPRITRSKKPDANIESTADSGSAAEVASVKSKDSENEEPIKKKRKTRKDTKSNTAATTASPAATAAVASTSSASTSKTSKVLPQRTKKLFKDYAFLLTNADRKPKPPQDTSDSDTCREEEDIVPFDKDELCSHIAAGGGIVLEKFDDIKKCSRKYIYLLANSYLRTMKYIQCIAAGISCIKHHWVQNCVFKSEILNLTSYILPSGFSIVTQQVIEWHGKTDVFKGCKIALVSAPESPFVYTWAPVLLAAKADFVQKWSLPSSVSGCSLVVDVLITNNLCPPDIIQSAKRRKIPIVSSEWIIQCLIMGKKLPFDAHPKFKYDYTEM